MNRVVKAVVGGALGLSMLVGVAGAAFAADPPAAPQGQQWQRGAGAGRGLGAGYQAISGPIAELLGMTAADIHAERVAGKSLAQIAQAKGVSEDQLVEAMLAARKSALDARVKAGTLTQEQADAAYQQMQTRIKESVNRTAVGPNRPEDGLGLGLGWGRGFKAGPGQAGQGTGPGLAHRYGGRINR